jgi:hypothetical protein
MSHNVNYVNFSFLFSHSLAFCQLFIIIFSNGDALVSTGIYETVIAGRGAAGLVKSGKIVIGNDYEYAYAA